MERIRIGCLARADSRRRARTPSRRRLIDVKSTTRLDDIFILDVPVQLSMLRGARRDFPDAGAMTFNREYRCDGVELNSTALGLKLGRTYV